jgi:hypothetical protein
VIDTIDVLSLKSHYAGYFSRGILSVLIAKKEGDSSAASTAKPTSSREWFNQSYQVYTPENYDLLEDYKTSPSYSPPLR